MNRRDYLRRASAGAVFALAGCLERLGFEEESAWRDPPLVENRPDAVYLPASTETMGQYGATTDGEYAIALSYTFPHRFWNVAGEETNRVTVETDDTMHLMCTVWDPQTETVLPTDLQIEIVRDDESVANFAPWPMLSQRMGFHYGDNVQLPEEGPYTAVIRVGPLETSATGQYADRFQSAQTLEIDFEYSRADIHDLEFTEIDHDRRGTRGALELMDHGIHDGHSDDEHNGHSDDEHGGETGTDTPGHPPTSRGRSIDALPGTPHGTARSGDAKFTLLETDTDRLATQEGTYLAIFSRTPYNDVILPFMSMTAVHEREGTVVTEEPLEETLDHELGHHSGVAVEELNNDDRVTVRIDSHPQVARHDGYETAFFDFEAVEFVV